MVRPAWNISSQLKYRGTVPVSIYKSKRSNLLVTVADVPGPLIKGYLNFPTEAKCDAGLPHTLEHLVFMGSEEYPYKGVLDIFANRCLASGTNAWTAQDHTCYTLSTVGSGGFLKILPVYIDHVLRPMLTNNQYITEVHHINDKGEDAGVVYSEMQDYESDMDDIMERKMRQLIFGKGHPYEVNTGGRLKAIREECSYKKVTDFHKQFYHLKNMGIIVCGMVDHNKLLEVIEQSEEKYLSTHSPETFIRPFSNAKIDDIKGSNVVVIDCPCEDETKGIVEIAFTGPDANSLYEYEALHILFRYLEDSAVSPLEKDFVQLSDPYASGVQITMTDYLRHIITVKFSDVPVTRINEIHERFLNKTIEEHMNEDKFDMDRMRTIISKQIEEMYLSLEKGGGDDIMRNFITHQIYGNIDDIKELEHRFNDQRDSEKLLTEDNRFWSDLVKKYFKKNANVCVIGMPSSKLIDEYAEKERKRIEEQQQKLGVEGMKNCGEALKSAIAANSMSKPSQELLDKFIITDLENFYSFDINTVSNIEGKKQSSFVKTFPVPTYIHKNPSKFVDAVILFDTEEIPVELRKYLKLFSDVLFESPAIVDGKELSYEKVTLEMKKDLIKKSFGIGACQSRFRTVANLTFKVAAKDYRNISKWANILLKNIVFDKKRIEILALRLANQAHEHKRDGSYMCSMLNTTIQYKNDSNEYLYNTVRLEDFHKDISKNILKNGDKVIENLKALRDHLLSGSINLHIMANEELIETFSDQNKSDWSFLTGCKNEELSLDASSSYNKDNFHKQGIIGVGGTESSFINQVLFFNQDYTGYDVAEVALFTQYLSHCEGPLWNKIRGKGLAYGANIYCQITEKLLGLSLYRCSQAIQAYEETKKVVLSIIDSGELSENNFEAAKRSLVYDIMSQEKNIKSATKIHFLASLHKLSPDFKRKLCIKIWNLRRDECFKKAAPHIRNLFDDSKTIRSIAVNRSKVNELTNAYPTANVYKVEDLHD
uniref:Presequence protease, mitochondrial n=1 Tax=Parastrongyloides trichosuri TaxID=131310 RepID=A0A0N4Z2N3_PARTI